MEGKTQAFSQSEITITALIILAAMTFLLWGSVYFVIRSSQHERAAFLEQIDYQQLGGQLAGASDFLTREARKHAVTGDSRHLDAYWDEINVVRTREQVTDRVRKLGAPQNEIDLLMLAKNNSNALVDTEIRSMRLTLEAAGVPKSSMRLEVAARALSPEDEALGNEAKRRLAVHILFDDHYDRAKASIMEAIEQFQREVNARTEAEVRRSYSATRAAFIALFAASGLVLFSMSAVLAIFQAQIASPVMKYTRALRSRRDDDPDFALAPTGTHELRTLADAINRQWRENQLQLSYNLQLRNAKLLHETLFKLDQMRDAPFGELMDCALETALALTRSAHGYIYLYDEATQLLTRCARFGIVSGRWSTIAASTTYRLAETGWLGEAIRERSSLIANGPAAGRHEDAIVEEVEIPNRHLSVPLIFDHRIVLLIGVINKETDYEQTDAENLSHLMNDTWKIVARRDAELELKESEARFRSIFEQAAVGISHCSLQGKYLRFNRKFCEILGYSPEEMLALSYQEITHPDDLPADLAHVAELVEGKIDTYSMEKRYLRKGGEPVWVDITVSLGRDSPRTQPYFFGVIAEITQRKQAEMELLNYRDRLEELVRQRTDQLQASEERLRALYRGVPFFTSTWQRRGDDLVLVDFNDAAVEVTGAKIKTFLGLNSAAYFGEHPEILSMMEHCYAERKTAAMETLYRLKATGEIHHMALRFAFVPPDLVLVHMDDIHERIRVESELRKLSVAIEQSPSSIVITDREGHIEYVNPKFTQTTGYTPEDARGMNPRILKGDTQPEVYEHLWREILSGREWRGEFHNRKKNGEYYWELAVIAPIKDEQGKITHFIAIKDDITERKRMEQALREGETRLRLLTENVSDLIWTMDLSGRFTYFSPSIERLFGYTPQEGLQMEIRHLITPASLAVALRKIEEVAVLASSGELIPSGTLELEHRRKDGSAVWAEVTFSGMYDYSGEFKGIVGATRDISERKRAEQIRSDFVAFVTHQLRTPLSGIKWMLELASDGSGTAEEVRSYILDAQASANRLTRLVNDMLDASRLEQGRISLKSARLDLRDLTRAVVNELNPLIQSRSQHLSLTAADNPATIDADPQLLHQAILNLTSNAIKYTPENGTIALKISDAGALLRWEVKDNGIGVPKDAQAKLFEKFFRAENAVTVETEGTGLGLYLVRLIIERLGGQVGCDSEPGQGSTFYFTLPRA